MRLSRESNPGPPALQANTMQRAIQMALLTAIGNLGLHYYSSPRAAMSQALDWGSWLSLTRTRIYLIGHVEIRKAREGARRSNLYCVRGSRALEPQNRVRIASRQGHHYEGGVCVGGGGCEDSDGVSRAVVVMVGGGGVGAYSC
jgi:hypothetical protein